MSWIRDVSSQNAVSYALEDTLRAHTLFLIPLTILDSTMKQEANEKAFDNFASNTKQSDATKSVTITDQIEGEFSSPESSRIGAILRTCTFAHNSFLVLISGFDVIA